MGKYDALWLPGAARGVENRRHIRVDYPVVLARRRLLQPCSPPDYFDIRPFGERTTVVINQNNRAQILTVSDKGRQKIESVN